MTKFFIDDFTRPGKHSAKFPQVVQIFEQPHAHWFAPPAGKRLAQPESRVRRLLKRAGDATVVLVMYNIPDRDMGQYSKGGADGHIHYDKFIEHFCRGVDGKEPWIIFEPDGLTLVANDPDKLQKRIDLYNVTLCDLKAAGCKVYVDIGHPRWLGPQQAAEILNRVNIQEYAGFSVNVSNFVPTEECIAWGEQVSALTGGSHFVIDTSRNGAPHEGTDWCNPPNKRLGPLPTTETNHPLVDAFLWIKVPGESDGYCQGGPKAGIFWPEYAAELLKP